MRRTALPAELLTGLVIALACLSGFPGKATADGNGETAAPAVDEDAPAEAAPEAAPPPVRIVKVSDSCYAGLQPQGKSNAGFIVGTKAVLVVDCFGSPERGADLLREVNLVTDKPIRYVVLTHWHYDHSVGNQAFPPEATILAARKSAETLEKRLKADRLLLGPGSGMHGTIGIGKVRNVGVILDKEKKIDLGGIEVRIVPAGNCHSAGDLVVFVPSEKVLFTGDLVWSGLHPNISGGSTFRWIASLAGLAKFEVEKIVPGHGKLGGKDLLSTQRRYLMSIRRMVKHLARKQVPAEEIFKKVRIPESYRDLGFASFWPASLKFIYGELSRGK